MLGTVMVGIKVPKPKSLMFFHVFKVKYDNGVTLIRKKVSTKNHMTFRLGVKSGTKVLWSILLYSYIMKSSYETAVPHNMTIDLVRITLSRSSQLL